MKTVANMVVCAPFVTKGWLVLSPTRAGKKMEAVKFGPWYW